MPRINYSRVYTPPNLTTEDLSSQVNGIVNTFTTSRGYDSQIVFIYVNGVLQRTGVEATVTGSTTFTLLSVPQIGSVLYVVYQPT